MMIAELSNRGILNPVRLINSIVRWIQGFSSPSGTIKIVNSMDPSSSSSVTVDVDVEVLLPKLINQLDKRYMQAKDVAAFADENGIHCTNNKFWIDSKYLTNGT